MGGGESADLRSPSAARCGRARLLSLTVDIYSSISIQPSRIHKKSPLHISRHNAAPWLSNCHRGEARERPEPPGSAPLAARGRYLKPVEALAHLHHPLQACTPLEEQPRAQQRRDATVPCRLSEVSCLLRSTWVARGQTWVERRWDGGASAWTRLSTQEAQPTAQRICSIHTCAAHARRSCSTMWSWWTYHISA